MDGKLWIAASLLALAAAASPARADEPIFGYVYTTDLLPQGKSEIEQWATLREGRSLGEFHLVQTRTEFSTGITNNFQLSGYLNFAHASVRHDGPDGSTIPPEVFADYNSDPDRGFRKTRFESVSVEGIYRLASPYKSGFGAAVYIEPTIGPRTRELENRFILQKNFIDDRLVFAFNATLGYEWRYLHGDPAADAGTVDARDHWDKETDVNFGVAGSYRFASGVSGGLELQNEREWAGLNPFNADHRTNLAWYFGPTLHYGGKHLFATFTTLFQMPWAHDYAEPDKSTDAVIHGISNADDFEKYRFRLKLGYYF